MFPKLTVALLPFAFITTALAVNITFDSSIIPSLHSSLPVFQLRAPLRVPDSILSQIVREVPILANGTGIIAQNGNRTVAVIDPDTGETTIYPRYESLQPSNGINTDGNATFINNTDLFPGDNTHIQAILGPTLYATTHTNDGTNNSAITSSYLSHVIFQRLVRIEQDFIPIRGLGSKAILGFGANGTVQSLNYLWNPANQSNTTVNPVSSRQIYNSIIAQLRPSAEIANLTVDTVELCYYDSGNSFIQPVFWFSATRHANFSGAGNTTQANARISGYVAVGNSSLEPLPDLTIPVNATQPTLLTNNDGSNATVGTTSRQSSSTTSIPTSRETTISPRGILPTVTIGRYIIRNDDAGWLASAVSFWNNLSSYASGHVNFINSQYYWAQPFVYTTSKQTYVNQVNVALTEGHGNWHVFSTYQQDWSSVVRITDIPNTGYGKGAGGQLAYWILHSCEVIPTNTDYPADPYSSFDVWWQVFNGLHAVMGYRTEMWIDDGVTTAFGKNIARGGSVVGSWMSAVLSDQSWYAPSKGNTYVDGNRGINEPMGRASSISVCGHTDDVVWDVENLGRPGCLFEWWYDN